MAKWYRVRDGVSISGDLHPGDVFDASQERFRNHDIDFLLKRGDIMEATKEDAKAEEDKVFMPGLAKIAADASLPTTVLEARPMTDEERAAAEAAAAAAGRGDHDLAIQQSRGDVMQPPEVVAAVAPASAQAPATATTDAKAATADKPAAKK